MRYHSRADQGKGSHIEILAADSNVDCNDANASLLMRTLLTTPCKLAKAAWQTVTRSSLLPLK